MRSLERFYILKNVIHTVQISPHQIRKETQRILENSAKRIQQVFRDDETQTAGLQEELVQQATIAFRKYVEGDSSFWDTVPFTSRQLKRVLNGVFQEPDIYFKHMKMMERLIYCLKSKKNNSLIKSLIKILFENWDTLQLEYPEVKELLFTLAEECVSSYGGKREFLLFCKVNPGLLSTKGPALFGAYLVKSQGLTVEEKLWDIGLSSNSLNYQYIEHAIINYYFIIFKGEKIDFDAVLQDTERILSKIDYSVGLIIVCIIIKNLEKTKLLQKQRIISFALRTLGDPLHSPRWIYNKKENRFKQYHTIVKEARNFILEEMNREILTLFFSIIAGDEKRKKFWDAYLKKVDDIKIVASQMEKSELLARKEGKDKEELINARFIQALHGPTAILLFLSNRVIVEFSEIGNATYVYNKDNPVFEKVFKDNVIRNTTSLKQPQVPTLSRNSLLYGSKLYGSFKNCEFRVVHTNDYKGWEQFYRQWLKEILEI